MSSIVLALRRVRGGDFLTARIIASDLKYISSNSDIKDVKLRAHIMALFRSSRRFALTAMAILCVGSAASAEDKLPAWIGIENGKLFLKVTVEEKPAQVVLAEGPIQQVPGFPTDRGYFVVKLGADQLLIITPGGATTSVPVGDSVDAKDWQLSNLIEDTENRIKLRAVQVPLKSDPTKSQCFFIGEDGKTIPESAVFETQKDFRLTYVEPKRNLARQITEAGYISFGPNKYHADRLSSRGKLPVNAGSPHVGKNAEGETLTAGRTNSIGSGQNAEQIVRDTFTDFGEQVRTSLDSVIPIELSNPAVGAFRDMELMPDPKPMMLVGESGNGRSEILRSLVGLSQAGQLPEYPKDTTVFLSINASQIETGAGTVGKFGEKFSALEAHAKALTASGKKVVLIIDDAEKLIGTGTHSSNTNDFFSYMDTLVKNTEIKVVATTTSNAWANSFKASAKRIFEVYDHPSFTRAEVPKIVKQFSDLHYGEGKKLRKVIPDEMIKTIVDLALDYDPIGSDATKAINLYKKISAEIMREGITSSDISPGLLQKMAYKRFNVHPSEYDPKARIKLIDEFKPRALSVVTGPTAQNAITVAAESYRNNRYGTEGSGLPGMRLLLLGPPGVGKTELVKGIEKATGAKSIRITMTAGKTETELKKEIYEAVSKDPTAILFIDELEKAPIHVQNVLLEPLDSGTLVYTNPETNESVRVKLNRNQMIFASNAGGETIHAVDFNAKDTNLKELAISGGISEPLADRIAAANALEPPRTEAERLEIAKLQAKKLIEEQRVVLEKRYPGYKLEFNESKLDALLKEISKIEALHGRPMTDLLRARIASEVTDGLEAFDRGQEARAIEACLIRVIR